MTQEEKKLNTNEAKKEENKEFKRLRDLSLEEIKQLTLKKATITQRKFKDGTGAGYKLTLHLIKGFCEFEMPLERDQYFNILIKSGNDLNTTKPIMVGVYTRFSIGENEDGNKFYCVEAIINKKIRKSWFLSDLQIENLETLNKLNDFKWEDRNGLKVEDLMNVQDDFVE